MNFADGVGVVNLMYRYWTGVYERGDRKLVVSNGVGNWFPLRIQAPAELIKVTLRAL
jgi:predicted MPP superfamily phosphohydrolase